MVSCMAHADQHGFVALRLYNYSREIPPYGSVGAMLVRNAIIYLSRWIDTSVYIHVEHVNWWIDIIDVAVLC